MLVLWKSLTRCEWAGDDPIMQRYHDEDWGVPLHVDRALFELLVLEGAQAGLSWRTVLHRREGYRAAFDGFDIATVAAYTDADRERLRADARIIRNRAKINAAIANARATLAVQADHGSLDTYLWSFVNGGNPPKPLQEPRRHTRPNRRVARNEQGTPQLRLLLRRTHHLLRLHAVRRPRQRPRHQLLPLSLTGPRVRLAFACLTSVAQT